MHKLMFNFCLFLIDLPAINFFFRMCGPKSTERKLDDKHFGFPFDRKIDFDLFDEE